jgi:2'-5' RNA ligase
MYKDPPVWDRINSYALVTYIPDPLAGFLDRLRQELVPNCFLRAHVTILPPRPLCASPKMTWDFIREMARQFTPFEIALGAVDVFPVSDVIYINITTGSEVLKPMHDALNGNGLRRQEQFQYHPHVTLAQDLKSDEVDELVTVARTRWEECPFAKTFRAEKLYFVQNTRCKEWIDLGECSLRRGESKLVGALTDLLVG